MSMQRLSNAVKTFANENYGAIPSAGTARPPYVKIVRTTKIIIK